jgi:hypothetical protein
MHNDCVRPAWAGRANKAHVLVTASAGDGEHHK